MFRTTTTAMSSSPSAARRRTRPATGPTSGASEPGDSVVGLGVDQVNRRVFGRLRRGRQSSAHEAVEGRAGDAGDRREVTWSPCSMPALDRLRDDLDLVAAITMPAVTRP